MRALFLLLLLAQCHSHKLISYHVESASYRISQAESGDWSISFRVALERVPEGTIVESFTVNSKLLNARISGTVVEAAKVYPAPPDGRGFDPLPPGDPDNPLVFQDEFQGEIVLKFQQQYDTLKIAEFMPE